MKKDNIKDLIGFLNSDKIDNYSYVIIKFEKNYYLELEITNNKPYTPYLYKNKEFLGIYWSYWENLIYHNGLLLENKEYNFICFKACK